MKTGHLFLFNVDHLRSVVDTAGAFAFLPNIIRFVIRNTPPPPVVMGCCCSEPQGILASQDNLATTMDPERDVNIRQSTVSRGDSPSRSQSDTKQLEKDIRSAVPESHSKEEKLKKMPSIGTRMLLSQQSMSENSVPSNIVVREISDIQRSKQKTSSIPASKVMPWITQLVTKPFDSPSPPLSPSASSNHITTSTGFPTIASRPTSMMSHRSMRPQSTASSHASSKQTSHISSRSAQHYVAKTQRVVEDREIEPNDASDGSGVLR